MAKVEQPKNSDGTSLPGAEKSDRGALWILLAVLVLCGSTLWMTREAWLSRPAATSATKGVVDTPAGVSPGAAAYRQEPVTDAPHEEQRQQVKSDSGQISRNRADPAENRDEATATRPEIQPPGTETVEQLAVERSPRTAHAPQHPETTQRPEREKSARAALERERRAMEARLAQEKSQRAALERKAALERQRVLEARRAAEQAALDRARAEAELKAARQAAAETVQGRQTAGAAEVTYEEEPAKGVETANTDPEHSGSGGFLSNPCEGPTAKFLSTCR